MKPPSITPFASYLASPFLALFTRCVLVFAMLWSPAFAADKIPVVASFSILGDVVRVVGGDRVVVHELVEADQDAHVFAPKPSDAKKIAASKLVVTHGLGFEPWANKLIKASGYKGPVLVASKGVTPIKGDPHAWQNPNNVVIYAQNIAAHLAQIDPAGAASYLANVKAYVKQLETLDAWAKEQFGQIPAEQRKAITSHDAFGYLAAHYGLKFLAPQGVSTDSEPSAKQVATLIRQIKREKIRAVFVENMSNPKVVAQLSKDVGVTVGPTLYADALSGPNQAGSSYLKMMQHNVTHLVAGMKLN